MEIRKKLAIFGGGYEGEKLYYQLRKKGMEVKYIIDNYKTGKFYDLKIFKLEEIKDSLSELLILVSSEKHYLEIREQLKTYGLKEFEHFVVGKLFGKNWWLLMQIVMER